MIAKLVALRAMWIKDKTTLYMLYWAVDEFDFKKITNAKSSKEAWDILEKTYKG